MNAFSIALITKALLGTSPISSVSYVLSLFTPFTMGQYTIVMNGLFILLEMTMMKRREISGKRYELPAQVPVVVCFGAAIDVSMHIMQSFVPSPYPAQLATLAAGCLLPGAGVSLEVKACPTTLTRTTPYARQQASGGSRRRHRRRDSRHAPGLLQASCSIATRTAQ